jgi:trehalose/maltose transport system substrate-binding protein
MAFPRGTREIRASGSWLSRARRVAYGVLYLLLLLTQACRKTGASAPVKTLTLMDQTWVSRDYQRRLNGELALFQQQTGIRVDFLPAAETTTEQLAAYRKLLASKATVPDVLGIDVIWPGILADDLVDLRAYIPQQEIQAHFPELIAANTVKGRLVALPANLNEGMLFYRVDLLRKYGYRAPPKTWGELEAMARRIQAGERASGHKNFWGFVWEGAPYEALTCNALEWQVSEGGGTILDENGRVTVNNPRAIHAWEMATGWVGSISPPGVVLYKEWDAGNLWQAGNAAFLRSWASEYIADHQLSCPIRDRFDIAPLPSGTRTAAVLGGSGFGVSRYSLHPREAAMLVRFLSGREEQVTRCRNTTDAPTLPQLYADPDLLATNPQFPEVLEVFHQGVVLRPTTSAGKMYPDVSRAYWEAVHGVLTRQEPARQAAGELQVKLEHILGTSDVRGSADANGAPEQR